MMYGWLSSRNRKRQQRAMNHMVSLLNKSIEVDDLWKGRFYVRQVSAQWHPYPDGSGADLFVVLKFIDKKTGSTCLVADTVNHWRYFNGSSLWWEMNDFIIRIEHNI